jgi:hypothetical protein
MRSEARRLRPSFRHEHQRAAVRRLGLRNIVRNHSLPARGGRRLSVDPSLPDGFLKPVCLGGFRRLRLTRLEGRSAASRAPSRRRSGPNLSLRSLPSPDPDEWLRNRAVIGANRCRAGRRRRRLNLSWSGREAEKPLRRRRRSTCPLAPDPWDPKRSPRESRRLSHFGAPRAAPRMQAKALRRRGPIHAQSDVILGFCRRLHRIRAMSAPHARLGRPRQQRNRPSARGWPLHRRHRRRRAQMSGGAGQVRIFLWRGADKLI